MAKELNPILIGLKANETPDVYFENINSVIQQDNYIWYKGDSNKLIERYAGTPQNIKGPLEKHNYLGEFENTKDYFWAKAGLEEDIKFTHSSLPKTIIRAFDVVVGKPTIEALADDFDDEDGKYNFEDNQRLQEIIKENNFYETLKTQQRLTLAIGDGCYFVSIDKSISDYPIIEWFDGRNIRFQWRKNKIIGVLTRRYFEEKNIRYVLYERRGMERQIRKNSEKEYETVATIHYSLFKLNDRGTADKEVSLKDTSETRYLENVALNSIDKMIAVPTFYDVDTDTKRGLSLFSGKLDLFDDLDQTLSQASNTVRLSTPVEYVPADRLDTDADGSKKPIKKFNRKYMVIPEDLNGVGQFTNRIETTQPNLNFAEYNLNALEITHNILAGIISPATLGIELSRKDNAEAQREKEKITLATKDYIVDNQMRILEKLFEIVLKVHDLMQDQDAKVGDYRIKVNYPEYANPSFDSKLASLIPALASGSIRPETYVDELWGDSLSNEDKQKEIEYIYSQRPNLKISDDADAFKNLFDFESDEEEIEESEE